MIDKNLKYPLLVLLVYVCTSGAFVLFFGTFYYQSKKNDILNHTSFILHDGARQIAYIRRTNGDMDGIFGFRNYDINIFNLAQNSYEVQEFNDIPNELTQAIKHLQKDFKQNSKKKTKPSYPLDETLPPPNIAPPDEKALPEHITPDEKSPQNTKPKERINNFIISQNYAYYIAPIHKRSHVLILRTNELHKANARLFASVLVICLLSFGVVLVLSYFIVRLAYAPLLGHIKALNTFITDTTHEINTPLSVILMSLEMYEKNPQKYLANIKNAAFSLSQLFSDLSSTLKTQPLSFEHIDVSALIKERVGFFELSASKKQISFKLDLAPLELTSDKFRLSKIIDNLLSNAIKYSFSGEIISVSLENNKLAIAQKGVVINKQNLEKIYDKFTRFDRTNGGFGIGLSLVKRFCDELNYTITASSNEEQTTFCVSFI